MEEVFLIFNRILACVYSHQCICTQRAVFEKICKTIYSHAPSHVLHLKLMTKEAASVPKAKIP